MFLYLLYSSLNLLPFLVEAYLDYPKSILYPHDRSSELQYLCTRLVLVNLLLLQSEASDNDDCLQVIMTWLKCMKWNWQNLNWLQLNWIQFNLPISISYLTAAEWPDRTNRAVTQLRDHLGDYYRSTCLQREKKTKE